MNAEENLDRIEVTPNAEAAMTAQVRGSFFIARGVELEESSANTVLAKAFDKIGGFVTDTEQDVTLSTSAAASYTYDDAGCLTDDGPSTYVYDDQHRLVNVEDSGGSILWTAQYDGLSRRVKTVAGGTTTRYVYDGENVIEEYDGSNALEAKYVHGIGIDNVLTIERDGNRYYYHHDGLGSVTELTDSTGALAQAYEYDAWGVPTIYNPQSAIRNRYLYTGREWDAEIALYYYRARHYAPSLGRFLQPDPIGYDAGPNLYTYVTNTPTCSTDPDGLENKIEACGAAVEFHINMEGKIETTREFTETTDAHKGGSSWEGTWGLKVDMKDYQYKKGTEGKWKKPDHTWGDIEVTVDYTVTLPSGTACDLIILEFTMAKLRFYNVRGKTHRQAALQIQTEAGKLVDSVTKQMKEGDASLETKGKLACQDHVVKNNWKIEEWTPRKKNQNPKPRDDPGFDLTMDATLDVRCYKKLPTGGGGSCE